jgi:hypothetical protein
LHENRRRRPDVKQDDRRTPEVSLPRMVSDWFEYMVQVKWQVFKIKFLVFKKDFILITNRVKPQHKIRAVYFCGLF